MSPRRPIAFHLSRFIFDYLIALPVGCVAALVWANTLPDSYYSFAHASAFFVNDVGMAFFLALITKEVAEATLPGGALHPWRRAAMPVAASIGGMGASIAGYLAFVEYAGEPVLQSGWAVACAVDIAGGYVIARLIFGRHPAVPFLLVLAIAADVIGLLCLGISQDIVDLHPVVGLGLMAVALAVAAALRLRHTRSFWPYVLGPGVIAWWALFLGGVYPALALVPIVLFLPRGQRARDLLVDAPPQAHDTLTLFERWWLLPVEGVLLLFGLVNAGVPLHGFEAGMWALPVAALAKPIGVVAGAAVAVAAGLHLPERVGWRELCVIGCISSIGLVFALLFATAAFAAGPVLLEMKTGALVTVAGAGLALVVARLLRVGPAAR